MTVLGQISLWLALLVAAWGTVTGVLGGMRQRPELIQSARRAPFALLGLLAVAAASLLTALLRHDFNVAYVAEKTSRNLPTVYTIAAFYSGQEGSLLFWAFVLSIFSAAAQWLTPRRYQALMPQVAAVTSGIMVFFLATMVFAANPFNRLPFTPADGSGLNPQLQNPGMVIHPPMLYLGYISISIPFAFAIAALISRRLDTGWLHAIRRWTLLSWTFLSVGITLGMWWAYVELGGGGYWAWDPVENASLLPWLTMTAFLHSVMIQEKRGMLKKWNVTLVTLSFMLSIFGTFITRSGVISSVHSFTQSSVGWFFLVFLMLTAAGLGWLLWTRLPELKTEAQLESAQSREASFYFNNLLLVGVAFSVFWGTVFPILSEWVRGTKITVGPPFFNQVNIPIGLVLLGLTGVGPLIAWRKASPQNLKRQFAVPVASGVAMAVILLTLRYGDFYAGVAASLAAFVVATVVQEFGRGVSARHRLHGEHYAVAFARLVGRNRRRYGGYVVHLGIVTYFVAFSGLAFKREMEASLKPGQSATLRSPYGHTYTFTHLGVSQYDRLNRFVTAASVEVQRDGKRLGVMSSEKRQYVDSFNRPTFQPATEAAIRSDLREDLYIVFAGSVAGTEEAVYRFTLNPLVWWVWFGGLVLVTGGAIVMWPGAGPTKASLRRALPGYAVTLTGAADGGSGERDS
jgi:cytochrome c-type biogenesis protein CcmF